MSRDATTSSQYGEIPEKILMKAGKNSLENARKTKGFLQKNSFVRACALFSAAQSWYQRNDDDEGAKDAASALQALSFRLLRACVRLLDSGFDSGLISIPEIARVTSDLLADLMQQNDDEVKSLDEIAPGQERWSSAFYAMQRHTDRVRYIIKFISDCCIDLLGPAPCSFVHFVLNDVGDFGLRHALSCIENHYVLTDNGKDISRVIEYFSWYITLFQCVLAGANKRLHSDIAISINDSLDNTYRHELCEKNDKRKIQPLEKMAQHLIDCRKLFLRTFFANGEKSMYETLKNLCESTMKQNEKIRQGSAAVFSELDPGNDSKMAVDYTICLGRVLMLGCADNVNMVVERIKRYIGDDSREDLLSALAEGLVASLDRRDRIKATTNTNLVTKCLVDHISLIQIEEYHRTKVENSASEHVDSYENTSNVVIWDRKKVDFATATQISAVNNCITGTRESVKKHYSILSKLQSRTVKILPDRKYDTSVSLFVIKTLESFDLLKTERVERDSVPSNGKPTTAFIRKIWKIWLVGLVGWFGSLVLSFEISKENVYVKAMYRAKRKADQKKVLLKSIKYLPMWHSLQNMKDELKLEYISGHTISNFPTNQRSNARDKLTSSQAQEEVGDVQAMGAISKGGQREKILKTREHVRKIIIAHEPISSPQMSSEIMKVVEICERAVELEFRDCEVTENFLRELNDHLSKTDHQITKFTVAATKNVSTLFHEIRRLLQRGGVRALDLDESDVQAKDLKNATIESIKRTSAVLFQNKILSTALLRLTLTALDISYNKTIEDFSLLGEVLWGSSITHLVMVECGLKDNQMNSLQLAAKCGMITNLNISYNADLTENGYTSVCRILTPYIIEGFVLSGCEVSAASLVAIQEALDKQAEIDYLDLSYSGAVTKDWIKEMCMLFEQRSVRRACVAGCDLDPGLLNDLRVSLHQCKLEDLDVGDSPAIRSALKDLGILIREHRLLTLRYADSMPNHQIILDFVDGIGEWQLETLDISNCERNVTPEFARTVGHHLIPCVKKNLVLCCGQVNEFCKQILQNCVNKQDNEELRIVIEKTKENIKEMHGFTVVLEKSEPKVIAKHRR